MVRLVPSTVDPQIAFEAAIAAGYLCANQPNAENYAGKFMFMGEDADTGALVFKHRDTRRYVLLPDMV